jgi:tetratricopeptide (TPR) repeat protein
MAVAEDPRMRAEAERRRAATVVIKRSSVVPKIIAGFLGVLVIGGALLQLTSYGAFAHLWIGDRLNAGEYLKAAQQGGERARRRMGTDTYAEARAAADELAQAHAQKPRSRQLAAYAALAQYMVELRFGKDAQTNARASQWIGEVPPAADTKYLPVAQAAKAALEADFVKARRGLDTASKAVGNDPLQQDIAFTRGELELAAKDGPEAIKAFKRAAELAPTARAHFGLARAYEMSGDHAKAKEEVNLALKASPNDAGALALRAALAYKRDHDEASALRDIEQVTEKAAKATASPGELAQVHALRGWIHLSRDRAADARLSFDQALKLDGRSVMALVGQGEVLYQDSRFAEALARFDTAISNDPLSVDAIIGDAKAQISLERLADAKTQLAAARAKFPKDMRVALWLGKAEEALGNKKAAEDQYLAAIDLTDPAADDAVSAYAALASLLAGEGRAPEAQAKLDQAKQRLPDSAALQRAFGEISAAQGHYEEAIAHYESTLQRDPNDIGARFRLGVTLRHMRKIEEAARQLDLVYAADKEYPGLALERGLLYEESGEVQKALEMFKGALDKAPTDPDLQLRVGAAYVAIGRPDDGMPLLQKVLALRPNSAEAQHYLGRAYLQKGGLSQSQAMRYLEKARDLDPQRPEYHLYVGWAANEGNPADLHKARQEIEKALSLDRLLADGYWQLGVVERKSGQPDDAIRHLQKALELRPNRNEAHAELAQAYWDKNNAPAALTEWKRAVDADQSKAFWRYRYGQLLFDRAAFGEAAKHLSFAATNTESDSPRPGWLPNCEFLAGEANKKVGKKAEAIERFNRFMEYAASGDPFRKDADRALKELGAPYDARGL